MKTKYLLIAFLLMFSLSADISAQSFLKKLADGIEKVGKQVENVNQFLNEVTSGAKPEQQTAAPQETQVQQNTDSNQTVDCSNVTFEHIEKEKKMSNGRSMYMNYPVMKGLNDNSLMQEVNKIIAGNMDKLIANEEISEFDAVYFSYEIINDPKKNGCFLSISQTVLIAEMKFGTQNMMVTNIDLKNRKLYLSTKDLFGITEKDIPMLNQTIIIYFDKIASEIGAQKNEYPSIKTVKDLDKLQFGYKDGEPAFVIYSEAGATFAHAYYAIPFSIPKEQSTQNQEELENLASIHGNVREITETNVYKGITTQNIFRFNDKKQLTEIHLTSYDGKGKVSCKFEYNDAGKVEKRTTMMTDAEYPFLFRLDDVAINEEPYKIKRFSSALASGENTETYTYKNNKLATIKISYKDDYSSGTRISEFNAQEKVVKMTNKDNTSNVNEFTYVYDANGNLKQSYINGEEEDMDMVDWFDINEEDIIKKHDAKGRLTSFEHYFTTGNYTYNNNDNILTYNEEDRYSGRNSITYSNYAYDEKKNWTKRTMTKKLEDYKTGPIIVNTTRKIVYY